jgi:hypothetical protein
MNHNQKEVIMGIRQEVVSHKNSISNFFGLAALILLLTFLLAPMAFAQWEQSTRLTYHDSISTTSYNNARYVAAAPGGFVHVVWFEKNRELNTYRVYYKRSTDNGTSWSSDIRLPSQSRAAFPSIALSENNRIHLIRQHSAVGGPRKLCYMRSTDGGTTWPISIILADGPKWYSWHPTITIADSVVHVVFWEEEFQVIHQRSTDLGATWDSGQTLLYENYKTAHPAVAAADSNVHIVFWSNRNGNNHEIYYFRSTDYGTSWNGEPIRLTNAQKTSRHPSIAVSGTNNIHVVWQDNRDGNDEIYYKRSTDNGVTWEQDMRLTNAPNSSRHPSIVVSGINIHLVWQDNRTGNDEIYYKCSTDEGVTWEPDVCLTNDIHWSIFPSIAIADTMVHVVWTDDRDGNPEIYYKRNPTGNY